MDDDPGRLKALEELNKPLLREGYEAFYGDDNLLYIRHNGTKTVSVSNNPSPAPHASRNKTKDITDSVP